MLTILMRGHSNNIGRITSKAMDFCDVRIMEYFVEYQVAIGASQFINWHPYIPLVVGMNR